MLTTTHGNLIAVSDNGTTVFLAIGQITDYEWTKAVAQHGAAAGYSDWNYGETRWGGDEVKAWILTTTPA